MIFVRRKWQTESFSLGTVSDDTWQVETCYSPSNPRRIIRLLPWVGCCGQSLRLPPLPLDLAPGSYRSPLSPLSLTCRELTTEPRDFAAFPTLFDLSRSGSLCCEKSNHVNCKHKSLKKKFETSWADKTVFFPKFNVMKKIEWLRRQSPNPFEISIELNCKQNKKNKRAAPYRFKRK